MLEVNKSINAIIKTGKQHAPKTELKEETKKQLEALGIDPSTVTSEADAKTKIKEAEAAQAQTNVKALQVNDTNPMHQVFADAKELAERLGLKISPTADIKDLLNDIEKRINTFEQGAIDNPEQEGVVKELKEEFQGINSNYNETLRLETKITKEMGEKASLNKMNSRVETSNVTRLQIQELEVAQSGRKDSIVKQQELENMLSNRLLPEGPEPKPVAKQTNAKNSDKSKDQNKQNPFGLDDKEREPNRSNLPVFEEVSKENLTDKENEVTDITHKDIGKVNADKKRSDNIFINGIATQRGSDIDVNAKNIKDHNFDGIKALADKVGISTENVSDGFSLLQKINEKISELEAQQGNSLASELRNEYERTYSAYLKNNIN